ncbi:MAG: flagellar hook-associated protein FlgL [Rhodocyclaceae bacterium]|nr:flagellar hook-associated protein FlgL [Rhodocyclaceae bacterium]
MRVSTSMIYDFGRTAMQRQTADFMNTQLQLASGRRVLKPSDDPVSSARALEVSQSKNVNAQFMENLGYARDALRLVEGTMASVTEGITYVRTRAVESGNDTLSQPELDSLAADLRAQYEQLRALANTRDGEGQYLFSGYAINDEPFVGDLTAPATTYAGDAGVRRIQVSSSREIPVSAPGDQVFGDGVTGLFADLRTFIDRLESGTFNATDVDNAITAMDGALDMVLRERASVGSRLGELDAIENVSADFDLQYAETLSRLQDLDYTEAISRFSKQQTLLEAAQQSYVRVTGLSLFDLLR